MHHLALAFVLPFVVSLCRRLPLPAAFTWYMKSAGKKIPSPCHLGLPSSGHQSLKCCAVPCLVTQSCGTLCSLMDCSFPESSVHGDSPGKNTGGIAIPSSRGSSQPRVEPRSPTLQADSLPPKPQGKPKNTGVCSLSLLQQRDRLYLLQTIPGRFLGSNRGLLRCRRIFFFFTN